VTIPPALLKEISTHILQCFHSQICTKTRALKKPGCLFLDWGRSVWQSINTLLTNPEIHYWLVVLSEESSSTTSIIIYIRVVKNSSKFDFVLLNLCICLRSSFFSQFFGVITLVGLSKLLQLHHVALIPNI